MLYLVVFDLLYDLFVVTDALLLLQLVRTEGKTHKIAAVGIILLLQLIHIGLQVRLQ